jgi:hypothetical protein
MVPDVHVRTGSPPWPRAESIRFDESRLLINLKDGRELAVPIEWFDWLALASDTQRRDVSIVEGGAGLWWNALDEGLSVPWFFGLPENPPRPRRHRYEIHYRREGRKWIAEIPDFESWAPARSLAAAKREGREVLAMLLNVEDLAEAGVDVTDIVESGPAVDAS